MPLKVVGLLARQHGLAGLHALLNSPSYDVVAVATHRRQPKSQDATQAERPDFNDYLTLSATHHFPLYTVDSKEEQKELEKTLLAIDFDLLVSISWRRLIPLNVIQRARVGAINLHRGRLPEYPGAEPIKQALTKGDSTITITAHILDEKIDHGKTVCVYEHPVAYRTADSLDVNVERLKNELTPHFGPLLLKALEIVKA